VGGEWGKKSAVEVVNRTVVKTLEMPVRENPNNCFYFILSKLAEGGRL
jgi:hypothetical protein